MQDDSALTSGDFTPGSADIAAFKTPIAQTQDPILFPQVTQVVRDVPLHDKRILAGALRRPHQPQGLMGKRGCVLRDVAGWSC